MMEQLAANQNNKNFPSLLPWHVWSNYSNNIKLIWPYLNLLTQPSCQQRVSIIFPQNIIMCS